MVKLSSKDIGPIKDLAMQIFHNTRKFHSQNANEMRIEIIVRAVLDYIKTKGVDINVEWVD
jgi:hypothetical protein